MPILNVEIVGPIADALLPDLPSRLADLAGEALDSRPQGTWVKVQFTPAEHYAENAGGPPDGVWPVIVTVLLASVPQGDALANKARVLSTAIAGAVERSADQVHILIEPPAKGRIFFGGNSG